MSSDIQVTTVSKAAPSFRPGNITRIFMKDFLTFSNAIFHPGPRMNLVIGPNGSGKSTIVACVCLVFAGNPRLLGRSPDLGSFVRHGSDEAEIEAWIYEPSEANQFISVKRVFNTDGKGSFFINGKTAKQADIISLIVKKYDIQLDNLSQFMPQEKIAEFTNIKPNEILGITVRSLGGVEKEHLLESLIEKDKSLSGEAKAVSQNQATLEQLEEQQENVREEVEAFKAQQDIRDKIKLLQRFIPLVAARELEARLTELKQQLQACDQEISSREQELQAASAGTLNAITQKLDAAKSAFRDTRGSIKDVEERNQTNMDQLHTLSLGIVQTTSELKEAGSAADRMRAAIQNIQTKLNREKEKLAGLQEQDLSAIEDDIKEHEAKRLQLREQRHEMQSTKVTHERNREDAGRNIKLNSDRLRGLGNERDQRVRSIARGSRDFLECDRFISDLIQQGRFQREVHGPIASCIETKTQYHARIMESAVSGFLVGAYVTESVADSRFLLSECRKAFHGKYTPDVVTVPTTRNDEIDVDTINRQSVPTRDVDDVLRRLGITTTVAAIYEAPRSVRAALNAHAGLHNIHVGNEDASQNQELLRNEAGMQAWYTDQYRVNLTRSRFDPTARNLRIDTQFANVTGGLYEKSVSGVAEEQKKIKEIIMKEEQRMQAAAKAIEDMNAQEAALVEGLKAIEDQIRGLANKRIEIRKQEEHVRHLEGNLETAKDRASRTDHEAEERRLKKNLRKLQEQSVNAVEKATKGLRTLKDKMSASDDALVERACAEQELDIENAKHASEREIIDSLKADKEKGMRLRKETKAEYRKRNEDCKRCVSEDLIMEHQDLVDELVREGSEELDKKIASLEGHVEGLFNGGQSVLDDFNQREKRIHKLRKDVKKLLQRQSRRETELREKRQNFLDWLKEGVEKMRSKFSKLYTRLGCSGDLHLINTDTGRLSDLALEILVSYRSGAELRPISNSANSGGEKMCCTMIFSFALQLEEQRVPPFVIVDELNQGLDLHNETKIMKMMIEDSEQDNAPQSFVITPKLLSNLPLSTCTKTHIIFNGPVRSKMDLLSSTNAR